MLPKFRTEEFAINGLCLVLLKRRSLAERYLGTEFIKSRLYVGLAWLLESEPCLRLFVPGQDTVFAPVPYDYLSVSESGHKEEGVA